MIFPQAKGTEKNVVASLSSVSKSVVASIAGSHGHNLDDVPIRGAEVAGSPESDETHSPFNYQAPMDNIVIRTFQCPMR